MNPEKIAQPSLGYSTSSHPASRTTISLEELQTPEYPSKHDRKQVSSLLHQLSLREHDHHQKKDYTGNQKPSGSYSTPVRSSNTVSQERLQFLREMKQAREELTRFRSEIKSLTRQMDGMALDIKESKKRVCAYTDRLVEIEQDLTATQEVNVNLQVLLENAVKTQKESDVFATQAIRTMYFDLASVVQGNNRLQGRLASIESHQREHKGNLHDVVRRIREYTQMLEQAQGTIHMLQEPQMTPTIKIHEDELSISSIGGSSRRTSEAFSSYTTEEDEGYPYAKESHLPDRSPSLPGLLSPKAAELYRYRFIHRRISLPPSVSPPQWQEQQMPSHEDLRVPMPDQERRGSLTAERK